MVARHTWAHGAEMHRYESSNCGASWFSSDYLSPVTSRTGGNQIYSLPTDRTTEVDWGDVVKADAGYVDGVGLESGTCSHSLSVLRIAREERITAGDESSEYLVFCAGECRR